MEEKKTLAETMSNWMGDIKDRTLSMMEDHPFLAGFMLGQHIIYWTIVILGFISNFKKEEA